MALIKSQLFEQLNNFGIRENWTDLKTDSYTVL